MLDHFYCSLHDFGPLGIQSAEDHLLHVSQAVAALLACKELCHLRVLLCVLVMVTLSVPTMFVNFEFFIESKPPPFPCFFTSVASRS